MNDDFQKQSRVNRTKQKVQVSFVEVSSKVDKFEIKTEKNHRRSGGNRLSQRDIQQAFDEFDD